MPKLARHSKSKRTLAQTADKYALYRLSVQDPEHEVPQFVRFFKDSFGAVPTSLREDFCAAAAVCCEWVKSAKDRVAVGVDLDPEPLAYGTKHYLSQLTDDQRARVSLREENVLDARHKADIIAAQNYSFYIFKERATVLKYFKAVRGALHTQGIFVVDMLGGGSLYDETTEESRQVARVTAADKLLPPFRYVWEQERFDPITHDALFHIHFRFPDDNSEIRRAFSYDWRLWTLPEVRELLVEAGFSKVHVYWETQDKDGNDSGNYRRASKGRPDRAWLAYVVAER